MKRSLAILLAAGFALAGAGVSNADNTVPREKAAFTHYIADKMRAAMPNVTVTLAAPLEVRFGDSRAFLDRIYDACQRTPDTCEQVTQNYVAGLAEDARMGSVPVTRAMLRAVVRPRAYVEELSRLLGKDEAASMVMRALAGDLLIVCYVDFPRTTRPATGRDFEKLHLSKDEALAIALKNTAAELPEPRADNETYVERRIGLLAGSAYESSRLALHDSWAGLARAFGGKLLVAVPGADIVLFTQEEKGAVAFLQGAARHMAEKNERPIAASVFRWTETGWEVAAP
jgi:hypothetical protein